jgi:histidinol-phosphate aminotransferase
MTSETTYLGGKSKSEISTSAEKIYKLSSNENMLGPSPKAVNAIKNALDDLSSYPDRTDKRLCKALAEYYGGTLETKNFFAANSGSECLEYLISAHVNPDDECIISYPAFGLYDVLLRWAEAKTVNVPLKGENFELDIEGILNSVTDKTKLIFLTSPNNPTGTYIKKNQLEALIKELPEHVTIVYDEVYYLFVEAQDYTIAKEYVESGKSIIAVNSFSKSHGLAGMRLGYMYASEKIIQKIRKKTRPFLINSLALEAGIAAISDEDYVKKSFETVRGGRNFLYEELDRIGLKYWKSQGNFIMVRPNMDAQMFEDRLIDFGIMTRHVGSFNAPGCVRVTVGEREANEAFIHAAERILDQNSNKQ